MIPTPAKVNKSRTKRLRASHIATPRTVNLPSIERITTKTERSIRLPNYLIGLLRECRDNCEVHRPIPQLVTACLKQTRGVQFLQLAPTPRNESEKVDVWLDPEFADIEHADIVARVAHALIGLHTKLIGQNDKLNKGGCFQ